MPQSPSNPGFSPELATFIVTKYDPLLGVVKTLNERLHATNRDRFRLEQRLDALERLVAALKGKDISQPAVDDELAQSDVRDLLKPEHQLIAPWLYSCIPKTPTSSIESALGFVPSQTTELDVRDWSSESDMWIDLLENLPHSVPVDHPRTLSLSDLRTSGRKALMEMVRKEVLVIVRNVPGKAAVREAAASLILVGLLACAVGESWRRVEKISPATLGRVAMTLEGDDLGKKLKIGDQKLQIEPLEFATAFAR